MMMMMTLMMTRAMIIRMRRRRRTCSEVLPSKLCTFVPCSWLSTFFQTQLVQSIGNKTRVLRSRWPEQSAKNKRERGDPARSSLQASSPFGEYREKQTHERHAREDAKASGGGFAARSRGSLLSPKYESLLTGQARSCLSSSGGSFCRPISHSSKYILLSRKPVSLVLK